ncbi:enoyl-CoA hydratase, partial [Duganella sp. FT134W]
AALAAAGEAALLMQGSLHTDELMAAVRAEPGLRTQRCLSHVFRAEVPLYEQVLLITDGVLNLQPALEDKADIARNAIDLAHALGSAAPRVAILAAVPTVSAAMPSTLDAAALCKMAERGQLSGALV